MQGSRVRRVGDQLRQVISELLSREVEDPRLAGVVITEARVTPDLRLATLYVSVYPADDARRHAAIAALERAAGFLRGQLARRIRLRTIPELRFRLDETGEYAAHIDDVLRDIHDHDADHEDGPTDGEPDTAES